MFTNIDIRKFRSCLDVRLSGLEAILVLIGRNGAGKTNILKALQWISQFGGGLVERSGNNARRVFSQDGDVAVTFIANGKSYCYELKKSSKFIISKNGSPEMLFEMSEKIYSCSESTKTLLINRDGEQVELTPVPGEETRKFEIAKGSSVLVAIESLFPEKSFFRALAHDIRNFLASVRYYPLHNFEETDDEFAITGQSYKKWKATRVKELTSVSSLLFSIIEMKEDREDSFFELNSLIGPSGLGLLDEIQVIAHKFAVPSASPSPFSEEEENTYYFVRFKIANGSADHQGYPLKDLSFGSIRIVYLLVSLLYDRATVSLVEQPEDGIHAALVDKLIPLLRQYAINAQFLIASHSAAVLNRATPEEIRLVSMSDGLTSARALSENELAAAQSYLEEDGPLSDFLTSLGED
jgi:predicted ATPase